MRTGRKGKGEPRAERPEMRERIMQVSECRMNGKGEPREERTEKRERRTQEMESRREEKG